MRTIVAAAIRQNDVICSMPRPARHHHIIRKLAEAGMPIPIDGAQGFIDNDGTFLDRYEAMTVARKAKQLIRRQGQNGPGGLLYSEDVW